MKHAKRVHAEGSKKGVKSQPQKEDASRAEAIIRGALVTAQAQVPNLLPCDQSKWGRDILETLAAFNAWFESNIIGFQKLTGKKLKALSVISENMRLGVLRIEEGTDPKSLVGVPKIVLEGQWLERLGYKIGQGVEVTVRQDRTVELKIVGGAR
jgi:hypothetical protein